MSKIRLHAAKRRYRIPTAFLSVLLALGTALTVVGIHVYYRAHVSADYSLQYSNAVDSHKRHTLVAAVGGSGPPYVNTGIDAPIQVRSPSHLTDVSTSYLPEKAQSCSLYQQLASVQGQGVQSYGDFLKVVVTNRPFVYIDVRADDWYAQALSRMTSTYIVSGNDVARDSYPDLEENAVVREYRPEDNLTFGELAKMTSLAAGILPVTTSAQNPNARGHWAESFVARLEQAGLSTFRTADLNRPVSRGAFIQAIVEGLRVPTENLGATLFIDLYGNHRYRTAIDAAARIGIIYGDTNEKSQFLYTARPDDLINRAEAVMILDRALRIVCRIDTQVRILPPALVAPQTIDGQSDEANNVQADAAEPQHAAAPTPMAQLCHDFTQAQEEEPLQRKSKLMLRIDGRRIVFRDVPIREWYSSLVSSLVLLGVMSGYDDTQFDIVPAQPLSQEEYEILQSDVSPADTSTQDADSKREREELLERYTESQDQSLIVSREFRPDGNLLFGEMAKIVANAAGIEPSISSPRNPSARSHWAAGFIAALEQRHLTDFQSSISVTLAVTRGTFIQALVEALGLQILPSEKLYYRDVSPQHPNYDAINAATEADIITGDTDSSGQPLFTARPSDLITRAEAIAIISRALTVYCESI